jgi:hypothetical protein
MAPYSGQRTQFTWHLNQYNLAEDAETKAKHARGMARYIAAAPANGFTVEQVTTGQIYPAAEVGQYLAATGIDAEPDISEGQALREIEGAVDTVDVVRLGAGPKAVYAYGYRCAPDRLKVGLSEIDVVQRISGQITTSTPDRPVLLLEIRTHNCIALERAIHATLEYRGSKISGGGKEWFKASREDVVAIYESVMKER